MLRRTTRIISRKYSRTWQGGLKASFTTNSVGDIVAGRVCTGNTDYNVRLPIETSISVTKCTGPNFSGCKAPFEVSSSVAFCPLPKCTIKHEMDEMNLNMNNLKHEIGYIHVLLLTNSFSIFVTNIALFLTHSH